MAVEALGPPVRLRAGATPAVAAALEREGELLLAAHVLDRQIFDARGMRLRRVGRFSSLIYGIVRDRDTMCEHAVGRLGSAAALAAIGLLAACVATLAVLSLVSP